MAVQIRRTVFDFLARDYKSSTPKVQLLPQGPRSMTATQLGTECILRCYLSLMGEDCPTLSQLVVAQHDATGQPVYRYDWAFGITLIEGYYWDWQAQLRNEGSLAIHIALQPVGSAPEANPISATISALHPSRNTKGFWELAWPKIPRTAAEMAKSMGEVAWPPLTYLSSGLTLASNVLESQAEKHKNWFLYQFLDEKLNCPVVEWRINKNVFIEYGPLLRGSLFLTFGGATKANSGGIRALFRPQIGYTPKDHLCYLIPTNNLSDDEQVSILIKPSDQATPTP